MDVSIRERGRRRDRWSSWVVILLVIVALALGWVVKTLAEGRTTPFEGDGVQARYPAGWVQVEAEYRVLLRVEDRWATPFRTSLTLQEAPLSPGSDKPLGVVQQMMSLERGQSWSMYRVLDIERSASGDGAMRVTFSYVEGNLSLFQETLPVVMLGEDRLVVRGESCYVVTLTSAQANYAQAQRQLARFVRSLEIE